MWSQAQQVSKFHRLLQLAWQSYFLLSAQLALFNLRQRHPVEILTRQKRVRYKVHLVYYENITVQVREDCDSNSSKSSLLPHIIVQISANPVGFSSLPLLSNY